MTTTKHTTMMEIEKRQIKVIKKERPGFYTSFLVMKRYNHSPTESFNNLIAQFRTFSEAINFLSLMAKDKQYDLQPTDLSAST